MSGMWLAYVAAGVALAAAVLYGYRTGTLMREATWPDRVMRMFILALLVSLAGAYLDVARSQTALLPRQWAVFAVLSGVAIAGAWPRKPRKPRR